MAEPAPEQSRFRGRWEVRTTPAFDAWLRSLDAERRDQVTAGLRRIAKVGPVLGRPRVDSIKGSRIHNLKELRLYDGVRVLFAFDPNRSAVMLIGGDKTGSWGRWYRQRIPVAERLYVDHLRSIGKGDRCLNRPEAGPKPPERSP